MTRTRVKICGITCVDDALLAVRAGADAIGMVFQPGARRFVGDAVARDILQALPAFVTPVGLFVDVPVEIVREKARLLGLRHIQLHGSESPEVVAQLSPLVVLKAVRVVNGELVDTLGLWKDAITRLKLTNLRGIILETASTTHAGGTGIANDWPTVADAQQRDAFTGLPPLIAAGGLRPENVADVIRLIRPFAVDVSSGVEASPGRKSPEHIQAFMRAVAEAETQMHPNEHR